MIAIAVVVALCAAFCFALGSLIQQGAARQAHAQALRFGLLVALVRQRRWLGGMAVTVLAFGMEAAALAFGPLALVQPLVATEVLFALPMIAHRNRLPASSVILGAAVFGERLARSPGLLALQLAGAAIAAAGITVLSRSPVRLAEERREPQSASRALASRR
jgi:hypothetical protein